MLRVVLPVVLVLLASLSARADEAAAPAAPAPATQPARPQPPPPPPPPPPCELMPVDLAVWHEVSLNALVHPCAHNYLGLSLLETRAGELTGVQIGLGVNGVNRSAWGVQIAGAGNFVGQ